MIISQTLPDHVRAAGHVPLSHRVRLGMGTPLWHRIIGICKDARYRAVTHTGADMVVPHLQAQAPLPARYLLVRGTRPVQELSALVHREVAETNPSQAVGKVLTIGELIERNTWRHRSNLILLLWFGACAVILGPAGVYRVITETVTARQGEITIKSALGANRQRLVLDAVSRTMRFALVGQSLGLSAVAVFGTLGSEFFHQVSARDPIVLSSVPGSLFVVSLGAAFWPGWNVARGGLKISLPTNSTRHATAS